MPRLPLLVALLALSRPVLGADEPGGAVATPVRSSTADAPKALLDQPIAEFAARRAALLTRIGEAESTRGVFSIRPAGGDGVATGQGSGPIVVLVGETEEAEDARFRQSNPFAYLTGIDAPHATAILRPGIGGSTLYLLPRDAREEAWTGAKLGPGKEAEAATGFDRVASSASFLADLFAAIGATGRRDPMGRSAPVYLLFPDPKPTDRGPAAALARVIREAAPNARLVDLAPILGELRKVKSAPEVNLLRWAVAITDDAHEAAARLIAPGVPEYRVEGAILGAFIGGGGTRAGFASIVGSGPNSTVLHYNANRRTMRDGELVVVDIGGEYAYYTADVTRTYPVSGTFTPRQREVYTLVLDCQSKVAAEFKVGETTLGSQNRSARAFFRESPLRAKDERGNERSMDVFFIHGLGHYLGMDVHDVGDASKPLGPGEVFTIEPGLYLPGEGFGVRIEDDYRVLKDGLENLSRGISSDPDAIERTMKAARSVGRSAASGR